MPYRRLTFPAVAALAIASLALGVLAALADGRDLAKPSAGSVDVPSSQAALKVSAPRPVPPTTAIAVYPGGGPFVRAAIPVAPCPADEKLPAAAPVPQNLLDAFGVLRRERADADTLPASALNALRRSGLEPFDPTTARLLRQTDNGGRAWVVPVRDVSANVGITFEMRCLARKLNRKRQALTERTREGRRQRAQRARPAVPERPSEHPAANDITKLTPHPGLAVVALDGAPGGAGGRLEDLVRGQEPVAIDHCGGPNRDMLSVSGIVPDGVSAAFLTSPDGTAVRADVKDNAYAFVVPRTKRADERYVVWTSGDGTPHVQPLGTPVFGPPACPAAAAHKPPTVSPDGYGMCGRFYRTPPIVVPAPSAPGRRAGQGNPPLLYQAPCALGAPLQRANPAPPSVRTAPKARRAPKRHG